MNLAMEFTKPLSIELLSPAKNLEVGLAAVNCGADAVYIGASAFGARFAAGNSVQDIETLVKYAHRFRVKVYVTLNTLLFDNELKSAEKLIWELYHAGIDSLIIQDLGILQMNLPPIPLHASTQTDNRTAEKVRFLQDAGLSRVVLARELNLQQISEIKQQTNVELEAFVHGALCVSYSGQCYISQAVCGRSANRGQCAQFCRLPYNLYDGNDNILLKNKHLLSLKDLDLSAYLGKMIDSGVSSFKIEGRLKDVDYVKNITAFYRKKLDVILENKLEYRKSSSGKTTFFFEPNPQKTFHRSASEYFIDTRKTGLVQQETPKSLGEKFGTVSIIGNNFIEINKFSNIDEAHNGDGLCFINQNEELTGFRVNRVEGNKIFPAEMPEIKINTIVFRNFDNEFNKLLEGKSSERKIALEIEFSELDESLENNGFLLKITDENGVSISQNIDFPKQTAQNPESSFQNIQTQLSKLGNTIFYVENVKINLKNACFFPVSKLNLWRREAIEKLEQKREDDYILIKEKRKDAKPNIEFPTKTLSYLGNVTNSFSMEFYKNCGVENIDSGFEIKPETGVPLMFTKYCIKYELGYCPKQNNKNPKEPLYIEHREKKFLLDFDCVKCEMRILAKN
jgi:Collagenase and related proteases